MSDQDPKPIGSYGGVRPGAGRKKKEKKFSGQIAKAERRIADQLPTLIDNMFVLANGGYPRVERKYSLTPSGEMIEVERKVTIAEPDKAANQYLIDRILGRPTERHEFEGLTDEELLAKIAVAPRETLGG